MKTENIFNLVKILSSYAVLKLSKGKIVTKTAHVKLAEARKRHAERVKAMQAELDKEHSMRRGWTGESVVYGHNRKSI